MHVCGTVGLTAEAFWSPGHLAAITGGSWLSFPVDQAAARGGLSIDTRTIQAGQVYLAIKGDHFDGHDFVPQAFDGGGAMAVVDRHVNPADRSRPGSSHRPLLLVGDTVQALHQIARAYRQLLRHHHVKVIAVTGSNGKSTTRHLIHTLLSSRYKGSQSPRSFNNHIGVPLTLLGASPDDDFVVTEIGSNHPGEIPALASIVRPDAAVITHIGVAHIGNFDSIEAIAAEKTSVLRFVEQGGMAVVPEGLGVEAPAGIRLKAAAERWSLLSSFSLPGDHNAHNAFAAIEVARWMSIDDSTMANALSDVQSLDGRLQLQRLGAGVILINDGYNANPDSVRVALDTLSRTPSARKVAILGDMLELGEHGPEAHRVSGRCLRELFHEDDLAILIGELSLLTAEELATYWPSDRVHTFPRWSDDLPRRITEWLEPEDAVLLKASRAMRLERLIPAIESRFGLHTPNST